MSAGFFAVAPVGIRLCCWEPPEPRDPWPSAPSTSASPGVNAPTPPPPKLLKNCPHRVRFRLGPASFMTWSPSILPLKRHLFMTGWEGLMASGLALQTGRLKTRPRYQAGPQGGNWAQKQMGPLCRSSKIGGAGAREKLSLQRPLTAREKEPCSGGQGRAPLWLPHVPPGQPGQAARTRAVFRASLGFCTMSNRINGSLP